MRGAREAARLRVTPISTGSGQFSTEIVGAVGAGGLVVDPLGAVRHRHHSSDRPEVLRDAIGLEHEGPLDLAVELALENDCPIEEPDRMEGLPEIEVFELGHVWMAKQLIADDNLLVRAGIQSIPRGQMEAARSLGMTVPQATGSCRVLAEAAVLADEDTWP